ncbi:hypothetical protein C8J57DRAFT_1519733 [Mycena rebaudengoi]|nr:hypothetical protein C8J57DRAFT_1519733 [Mycena rebaudengoi]
MQTAPSTQTTCRRDFFVAIFFYAQITRHIWTAPGSALFGAKRIPKMCNARSHGSFSITREMIAYSCVQARTMISTSDWTDKDGSFSVVKMFNKIVKLFEDPNDPWTIDTLQWYQQGVFGSAGGADDCEEGSDDDDDDDDDDTAAIIAGRGAPSSAAAFASHSRFPAFGSQCSCSRFAALALLDKLLYRQNLCTLAVSIIMLSVSINLSICTPAGLPPRSFPNFIFVLFAPEPRNQKFAPTCRV